MEPNGVLESAFYTYGERVDASGLPEDFFSVEPTQNLVLDKEVTLFGSDQVGPQVDEETGESFEPQYLGENAVVDGELYCLTGSELFMMDEEVGTDPPGDVSEDPENALDPDLDAAMTSVHATYDLLAPGELCEPGQDSSENGSTLEVISEYRPSPDATAWREAYREEAEEIDADPEADAETGGVIAVSVAGAPRTGYVTPMADDLDDPSSPPEPDSIALSVLIVGGTQVTINGDFDMDEIQQIANQLEPQ